MFLRNVNFIRLHSVTSQRIIIFRVGVSYLVKYSYLYANGYCVYRGERGKFDMLRKSSG